MTRRMTIFPYGLAFINYSRFHTSNINLYTMKMIEVERKFVLPTFGKSLSPSLESDPLSNPFSVMETKLTSLGLVRCQESVPFEDIYFDLVSPHWLLSTQDMWLRYRQYILPGDQIRGSWQLKRALNMNSKDNKSTVYEELEGEDALKEIWTLWKHFSPGKEILKVQEGAKNNFTIPGFPFPWQDLGLFFKPFARFKTNRYSWVMTDPDHPYESLRLDLDSTDFGYTVGEVETLVHSINEIPSAQEKITAFIQDLLGDINDDETKLGRWYNPDKVLGKLEVYLIENDMKHYEACVTAGTLQK